MINDGSATFNCLPFQPACSCVTHTFLHLFFNNYLTISQHNLNIDFKIYIIIFIDYQYLIYLLTMLKNNYLRIKPIRFV